MTEQAKQTQEIEKLRQQVASLTEAREGLQADYDETRKELNRVANLLFDECQSLKALTAVHERQQKDADWWKAIVASPPRCHGGPMKLRAANDTTASWGCTTCGAVDELSRAALVSLEGSK